MMSVDTPIENNEMDEESVSVSPKIYTLRVISNKGHCELIPVEDITSQLVKPLTQEHLSGTSYLNDILSQDQLDMDLSDIGNFQEKKRERMKINRTRIIPRTKTTPRNLRWLEEWRTEFPFLEYNKTQNKMFCKYCKKYVTDYRKASPFIVGTNNFRGSMIRYHERSSMHRECSDLVDVLIAEDEEALEKDLYNEQISHVFKAAYFIYKNKMPYVAFPQLCDSLKKDGTEILLYTTRDKACPLFGKFIGMAFEQQLAVKLSNVSEFSLIIDASFRRQIENHDLVYIKYIDGMIMQTAFLGVIDSTTKLSDSMYNTLTNLFRKYTIDKWYDKIVYIMADKSDNHLWLEGLIDIIDTMPLPNFISEVKYLPHKIKFCSNITANYQVTSTIDALLFNIYCYYEKVDVSKKNLIHMNKVLEGIVNHYGNLPKNSFITLCYDSLKAIEQDWALLVSLLSGEQQLISFDFNTRKCGHRILKIIMRSSFIRNMAILIDIFYWLDSFATKLGSESLMPYDVHILLEEVCLEIETAASGEGPMVKQISDELAEYPGFFREIEIVDDANTNQLQTEIRQFRSDVICYLKSLIDDTLLEKCFIFNVCLWPEDETLATFGNSEFLDIFLCFKGEEKYSECALVEWNHFKAKLSSIFPPEVKQDSRSVLIKMLSEHEREFPFVSPVLKKVLLLDFESSEIKRGYHEMCLNKSHYRSVLSLQSLQTMMMISMYGPSIAEFDCSLAIDLFLNSRNRQFRKKIVDQKLNSQNFSDF